MLVSGHSGGGLGAADATHAKLADEALSRLEAHVNELRARIARRECSEAARVLGRVSLEYGRAAANADTIEDSTTRGELTAKVNAAAETLKVLAEQVRGLCSRPSAWAIAAPVAALAAGLAALFGGTGVAETAALLGHGRVPPKGAREFCVAEGRPSWHQQRAGHGYGSLMCFSTRAAAEAYKSRVKALRPNEPAWIIER